MVSDVIEDKLTIKNILFTKALPNYTIPIPIDGHKIFPCTDCGDKFLLESSYNYHINRKSLQITYLCRYCGNVIIFNNRCKLLSHIRSHAFKTATINVSDLKIEPLPIQEINWTVAERPSNNKIIQKPTKNDICFECDEVINSTGAIQKDRTEHYMRYTNKVYMCPICLFTVPNTCMLIAHLRIHLRISPYFCPECGINLSSKSIRYPYFHDCEGIRMIRATTRVQCKKKNCNKIFHPNEYREHIKSHIKTTYKCLICFLVLGSKKNNKKHLPCLSDEAKIEVCRECEICNRMIPKKESTYAHLNKHYITTIEQLGNQVYPCLICNISFNVIPHLIKHQIDAHGACKDILSKFLLESDSKIVSKGIYRVVKRCDKCLRSFIYKCRLENIHMLPNACPYKCSNKNTINNLSPDKVGKNKIKCGICKVYVIDDWKAVKTHFSIFHKNHQCLDLILSLKRIEHMTSFIKQSGKLLHHKKNNRPRVKCIRKIKKSKKYLRDRKFTLESKLEPCSAPAENNWCKLCNIKYDDELHFQEHIITHRDPCMAYQCLECGQCFVVKPSFSTHLLLEHNISNVNEYIDKKKCYNELALSKHINSGSNEKHAPLKENQCKICRDQFENANDLEKHFRVHGMAFLMKNKNNSP